MKIVKQSVECITSTQNAAEVIEAAGRTCYKSESRITHESANAFVRTIIKSGHESVIEHASATFRIVTDRGISHEIVRHRLASYSQESTRFCNYGKKGGEITVIEPPFDMEAPAIVLSVQPESLLLRCLRFFWPKAWIEREPFDPIKAKKAWEESMKIIEETYLLLLKSGQKAQIARSVLPTCLKTEIVMTANFREWRHFIRMRSAKAAHPQVREIASMILGWFKENYPVIVEDIEAL